MSTPERVRTEIADGVANVRLADPEHRNALSAEVSGELEAAVKRVLAEQVKAIVVTAEPPAFCAGGSLDDLLDRKVPLEDIYRGFLAVADAEVPTIAAVNGAAVGAGMNLAIGCDVIVTSPRGRFEPRFLDLNIHPGGGHLWRLLNRVGPQATAAAVLCGEVLDGQQAAAVGLAWRCVPEDEVDSTALALGRAAARHPRELLVRTKATLRASGSITDPEDAVALERRVQEWSMTRPEFAEGIRAMQSKIKRRAT